MTISNEPGYYADGKFGIRIESIVLARPADTPNNFGDKGYLRFETVTMCVGTRSSALRGLSFLASESLRRHDRLTYNPQVPITQEPYRRLAAECRRQEMDRWVPSDCMGETLPIAQGRHGDVGVVKERNVTSVDLCTSGKYLKVSSRSVLTPL